MKPGKFFFSLVISTLTVVFYSCSKQQIGCGASTDCSKVSYSGTIQSLVETKCALSGCHSGEFSSYAGIKSIADNGSLYQVVVVNESMPAGGVAMSCEQRAQIECWVNAGSPNN